MARPGSRKGGRDGAMRTLIEYLNACAAVARQRKEVEAATPGSVRHAAGMERLAALKKARARLHKEMFGRLPRPTGYKLDD